MIHDKLTYESSVTFYPEESFERILNKASKKFSLLKSTCLPTNLQFWQSILSSWRLMQNSLSSDGHDKYGRKYK